MHSEDTQTTVQPRRMQYSMRALLVAVTILVCGIGIGAQFGIWIVTLIGAIVCLLFAMTHRGHRLDWLVAAVILLIVAALLIPAVSSATGAARRSACRQSLKQLGLALHNYHATWGSFPPAYIADKNGRPMHSWRVLILPQLERPDLYSRYRFDEPWDGPNNQKLHAEIVEELHCPSDGASANASYLAIVGPGAAWPGAESRSLSDFTDDASQTILVTEVADSGILWCEPRDLHVSQMSRTINGDQGQGISSHHDEGAHVLRADGSAHFLHESLSPTILTALLSPSGGEAIDEEEWRP